MPIMRASAAMANTNANHRRPPDNRDNRKSVITENRKSKPNLSNTSIANVNRSSIASYGGQVKVKTFFHFTRKKDDTPACFKFDGERFNYEQTLKLLSSTDYTVRMVVDPNMELLYIKLAGIEHSFTLVNEPEKDSKSVYQFHWSTNGIEPTENRHRADVLCAMKFKNYKEIEFRLQVKFYTVNHVRNATFGETLNNVQINCTAGRGTYTSFVDDMKIN